MAADRCEPVPGPFGGVDEGATMRAFEEFVGGVPRAERLLQLYLNSYPVCGLGGRVERSKAEVFTAKARREGFSAAQAEAWLALQ